MNDKQDTGNAEKLPLAERARRGLLAHEPDLALDEVLQLEHPGDPAARKALSKAIRAVIPYGDPVSRVVSQPWQKTVLKAEGGWLDGNPNWDRQRPVTISGETKTVLINRETYRDWRNACPAELLSPLTQIHKWLGAMPALPESILPVETSLSEKRQRIDALNNAIRAAIAVLSPSGALPRPHELFDYLAHNDATKTVTGVAKGNRALLWIDDNGNEQRLTFSALGKRLDRIRQGE